MLFNSYAFIFAFFPLAFAGFFFLARRSHALSAGWLALASLGFYGYWSLKALPLLLGSICANYLLSVEISSSVRGRAHQRIFLSLAVALNLAVLGFFKYADFFVSSVNVAGPLLGLPNLPLLHIVLPIGISFFTFTQIAFLVDCFQGKVQERNFVHYVLFVTYFPHLISGPVLHHAQMMPQFREAGTYRINFDNMSRGIILFAIGLVKKTIFADGFAGYADAVFAAVGAGQVPTVYEAWAGALAYAFQIYFDFSGYTDMALGISLMFNIVLPINFNSPYKATNIVEFWRRWHITLSSFLRDYLYIPLGGNRKGPAMRYVNLMLTMVLGGLWHGAAWTFVAWGALHGLFLCINHLWLLVVPRGLATWLPARIAGLTGGALTFMVVVAAWVVFRAGDMATSIRMWQAMAGVQATPIEFARVLHGGLFWVVARSGREFLQILLPAMIWIWMLPPSDRARLALGGRWLAMVQALLVCGVLILCMDSFGRYSPFLYFQF